MQQKALGINVCYNFAMGELKKDSPHGRGLYGERVQRDLLGGINLPVRRRKYNESTMSGDGMFDSPKVSPETPIVQPEEYPRAPLFKRGTVLYAAVYRNKSPVLPFNKVQADNLTKGVLDFDQNLEISENSMGIGKNGREIIKVIGKSTYGAFVEVVIHTKDRKGQVIAEKRFVRLGDRALSKDNPKLKFKNVT